MDIEFDQRIGDDWSVCHFDIQRWESPVFMSCFSIPDTESVKVLQESLFSKFIKTFRLVIQLEQA